MILMKRILPYIDVLMRYVRELNSFLKENCLSILSLLVAFYFLIVFHLHAGFVPIAPLTVTSAIYLLLFLIFLVLPFAQRLKVGRLIDFEARVERTRAEIKEVRTETRDLISTVSAMVNAISATINQSVVVNLPGSKEAQEAREEMSNVLSHSSEPPTKEKEIYEYFGAGEFDVHYALARLRMDIERELRRILGKRLITDDPSRMRGKFLTARSLFQRLVTTAPRYKNMQSSFDYILNYCNAAIHGQRIPPGPAYEAIDMGLDLLRELENENVL